MFNKKFSKREKITLISLLLVLLTATAIIAGTVAAKYITEKRVPGKIKVSVELAQSIEIFEHKVTRTEDGNYEIGADTCTGNTYKLMPGVDIPKDPTVRIKGYTGLPAYVYVEVVGEPAEVVGKPKTVSFAIDDGWAPLKDGETQVTGPNGGKVYYRELIAANNETYPKDVDINVLKEQKVTVSQWVERNTDLKIEFYAYVAEKTGNADAKTVFEANFAATPSAGN